MMKVVLMCLLGSITAIPVPVVEEMQSGSGDYSNTERSIPATVPEASFLQTFWRSPRNVEGENSTLIPSLPEQLLEKTTQNSPEVDVIPTVPTAGKLVADGPTEVGHFSPSPSPSESSTVEASTQPKRSDNSVTQVAAVGSEGQHAGVALDPGPSSRRSNLQMVALMRPRLRARNAEEDDDGNVKKAKRTAKGKKKGKGGNKKEKKNNKPKAEKKKKKFFDFSFELDDFGLLGDDPGQQDQPRSKPETAQAKANGGGSSSDSCSSSSSSSSSSSDSCDSSDSSDSSDSCDSSDSSDSCDSSDSSDSCGSSSSSSDSSDSSDSCSSSDSSD
ncbi:dentin sialophosphoprotein-like [Pygocentrus nattereri]|uniref:dentin sialophosphoprotein-like n=1 Tax=Pygocentrus nattereri TaxID=42514 RepID=UPI001891A80B|nr:dentin sialophosphoprotein-like [Pygocentrus nattereri]XP_037397065.1 dentin sialophosphoprotein-like [Pygocentrus nattereri]